tara:strand:+ start:20084 stop:20752 length:669 start_codon:yes stop_codon:yes gene_type:complete
MKTAKFAGGRRIKQRRKVKNPNSSDESYNQYRSAVCQFNKRLQDMKDNDYIKFRDFSTQLVDAVSQELKRGDFRDRDEFRKFKKERLRYLFSKIFYPFDSTKILVKSDNFNYIHSTFNEEGINVLNNMIVKLQESLEQKTYTQEDPAKEYNIESFNESCSILDICTNNTSKISFSHIKEQYEKKKTAVKDNMEEQLIINNAFLNIRNQYDNYLKHTPNKVEI